MNGHFTAPNLCCLYYGNQMAGRILKYLLIFVKSYTVAHKHRYSSHKMLVLSVDGTHNIQYEGTKQCSQNIFQPPIIKLTITSKASFDSVLFNLIIFAQIALFKSKLVMPYCMRSLWYLPVINMRPIMPYFVPLKMLI